MRVAVYMYHVVEIPDDTPEGDITNTAFDEAYALSPEDFKAYIEFEDCTVLED